MDSTFGVGRETVLIAFVLFQTWRALDIQSLVSHHSHRTVPDREGDNDQHFHVDISIRINNSSFGPKQLFHSKAISDPNQFPGQLSNRIKVSFSLNLRPHASQQTTEFRKWQPPSPIAKEKKQNPLNENHPKILKQIKCLVRWRCL